MSGWYLNGLEQLLSRTIPADAVVSAIGVNDAYVFDATHTDFTPIDPCMLLPLQELTNPTFTGGVLDADDTKWLAAGAGVLDRSLVLKGVIITFSNATVDVLLAYIDSASLGLPQTLTGVNVTATWDARGILSI